MPNLQHVQQLITELGPMVDDIGLIEQSEEATWLVLFNDETAVQIEYDEVGHKLIFLMVVAAAPDQDQLPLYTAMLHWNFLYEDTGGMRLAMEGEGNVVLIVELCHLDLDTQTLASFLESFTTTGLGWRQITLAQADRVSEGGPDSPADAIQV